MHVRTEAVGLFVPVDAAIFDYRGQRVMWLKDRTIIQEGHPILNGRRHMVRPLEIDYPAKKTAERQKAAA